jgi:hypothetical protein
MPRGAPKGRPRPPGSGRKRGTLNKDTEAIRLAVMKSFDHIGAWKYLVKISESQPAAYISLLNKILPHEMATSGGALKAEVLLRWMTPEMARNRGFLTIEAEKNSPGTD